jgi:hypothetical protein
VSCQYFPPCSFVLALRELGLRLGVKAPLPLRASSHGVPPGAGALAGYRTPIQPVCFTNAAAPKSKPIRVMHLVALRRLAQAPPVAKRSNERWRMGLFQCFRRPRKRKPTGAFLWLFSPHLKSQITSFSLTAAYVFPPPPAKRRAASDGRNSDTLACHMSCRGYVRD